MSDWFENALIKGTELNYEVLFQESFLLTDALLFINVVHV